MSIMMPVKMTVNKPSCAPFPPMKPKKQKPVPAVKPAKQKKITAAHVVWWLGCENPTAENLREAAQALADIANGTYAPETLRDDIAGTCDL